MLLLWDASTVNQYLVINDGRGYTFLFDANIAFSEYGEPQNTWVSISFFMMIALQSSEANNLTLVGEQLSSQHLKDIMVSFTHSSCR